MVADLLTQIETQGREKRSEGNGLCIKHERNKISISRVPMISSTKKLSSTIVRNDRETGFED